MRGNHWSAQKPALWDRPQRRLGPIALSYGHPAPRREPPPPPSSPRVKHGAGSGPVAMPRATVLALEVSVLGTSVALLQPRPCATAPAAFPISAMTNNPLSFPCQLPQSPPILPPLMRISPWLRFSRPATDERSASDTLPRCDQWRVLSSSSEQGSQGAILHPPQGLTGRATRSSPPSIRIPGPTTVPARARRGDRSISIEARHWCSMTSKVLR